MERLKIEEAGGRRGREMRGWMYSEEEI